jgi:hypothetical protein
MPQWVEASEHQSDEQCSAAKNKGQQILLALDFSLNSVAA